MMPFSKAALLALVLCASATLAQTGKNLALHRPATGSTPCNEDENPAQAFNGSVSGGTGDWNTRAFKIHVSTDGKAFTTVVTVTDNTADVSTHKFEPVIARYVQLEVVTPTQDGDPAARIYEFEIYGDAAAGK